VLAALAKDGKISAAITARLNAMPNRIVAGFAYLLIALLLVAPVNADHVIACHR
jgi:hypothetical protein